MNFKDKTFQIGALVFLGSLSALIFPKVVTYLLILALIGGVGAMGFSIYTQRKGQ